jgi:rfaE bifunctional protein nucleotidyltransferase chain/domain
MNIAEAAVPDTRGDRMHLVARHADAERPPDRTGDKLCARSALVRAAARLGRPLVFTNGVFDLLHRGHVECLDAARREGASLVVGINGDASAGTLGKGPGRPLNRAEDRAVVVAALQAVSLVVVFDEPTPLAVIAELRPDVYVKGGDYDIETLAETALVRGWGGRALALPYREGCSTTGVVRRIARLSVEMAT